MLPSDQREHIMTNKQFYGFTTLISLLASPMIGFLWFMVWN